MGIDKKVIPYRPNEKEFSFWTACVCASVCSMAREMRGHSLDGLAQPLQFRTSHAMQLTPPTLIRHHPLVGSAPACAAQHSSIDARQELARLFQSSAERSQTRPGSKLPIEELSGTDGRSRVRSGSAPLGSACGHMTRSGPEQVQHTWSATEGPAEKAAINGATETASAGLKCEGSSTSGNRRWWRRPCGFRRAVGSTSCRPSSRTRAHK
jgi:hypothetical protein